MKSICILILCLVCACYSVGAQQYLTRNGKISFYSHTAVEDIQADNNEVVGIINAATGDLEIKAAIKSFHFPKASMEEHFNDVQYMNSDQYPKASFKGKITNLADVNFQKNGNYKVTITGSLTIKDVTKQVQAEGVIAVNDGSITATAEFNIKRKDYHVLGEAFVQSKISEDIRITVNNVYNKM